MSSLVPRHCPEFKRELVHKVLTDKFKNLDQIAFENGVSRASLFRWVKALGAETSGFATRKVRPQDWSVASKLKALLETQSMSEKELGEYLRRKGLYFSHLLQWKTEVLEEVKKRGKNKIPDQEAALLRRIRELEREVKVKDKALREATAILVLKKKAESIWGVAEEDEKSAEKSEPKWSRSSKRRKRTEPGSQ
jgi:transposase